MLRIARLLIVGCGALAVAMTGCLFLVDTGDLGPGGPAPMDGSPTSVDSSPTNDAGEPVDAGPSDTGVASDGCACPAPTTCAADGCELPSATTCADAFPLRENVTYVVKLCAEDPKYTLRCDGGGARPTAYFRVGIESVWKFQIVGTDQIAVTTLLDCSSPAQCATGGNQASGTFAAGRVVAVSNQGPLCNRIKIHTER